jgi:MFS family permease
VIRDALCISTPDKQRRPAEHSIISRHSNPCDFQRPCAPSGIGAIVGALAVATRGKGRPPLSLLLGTAGVASGLTLLLAVIRSFWAAMLVLTLIGLSQIVFLASCNTMLQLVVPDRMRGRIISLYAFVWVGVTPLGSLLVGTIADWWGVAAAYALGGGMGLMCILGLVLLWKTQGGDLTLIQEASHHQDTKASGQARIF